MRPDTLLMMGLFRPRALRSAVFITLASESARIVYASPDLLLSIVGWTIFLIVVAHGVSALPLTNWYVNRLSAAEASIPELTDVAELSTLRQKSCSLPLHEPDKWSRCAINHQCLDFCMITSRRFWICSYSQCWRRFW